ncbi:MAG: WYL domain-containing protein [Oscillospiraceae bacterium]|nr:WYL domain-containing protein [Oscillospiraceae bacterium]
MTIFSEIYGVYYRIASRAMSRESLSDGDVYELIRELGFRDSALFLPRKLLPQKDSTDWGLLRRNADGSLSRITENAPPAVLTLLQKRWLKAKLSDARFRLFVDDETLDRLENRLADIKPMYRPEHFRYFDRFTDGDNYADPVYRANFRVVLEAIKACELLKISYVSGHGERVCFTCLPMRLEYSEKNDKLRLFNRKYRNGRLLNGSVINLGRITGIVRTGCFFTDSADAAGKKRGTVTVYVAPERNAVERFLMEFASYEKRVERDLVSGGCTAVLHYDKPDETELLIRLLSFGAAVEILKPEGFRAQAAERVAAQAKLTRGEI